MKIWSKGEIDKPWKIAIFVFATYTILKFPLRFLRADFSSPSGLTALSAITFVLFIASVLIVGVVYSKSTKKILSKEYRLRTALFVSGYSLIVGMFVAQLMNGFISTIDVIVATALNFLIVYYGINLGAKFVLKEFEQAADRIVREHEEQKKKRKK